MMSLEKYINNEFYLGSSREISSYLHKTWFLPRKARQHLNLLSKDKEKRRLRHPLKKTEAAYIALDFYRPVPTGTWGLIMSKSHDHHQAGKRQCIRRSKSVLQAQTKLRSWEREENWKKVCRKDGFIRYVRNKRPQDDIKIWRNRIYRSLPRGLHDQHVAQRDQRWHSGSVLQKIASRVPANLVYHGIPELINTDI